MRKILSIEDSARVEKVHRKTVERWLKRGLRHRFIEGQIFILKKNLSDWPRPKVGRPKRKGVKTNDKTGDVGLSGKSV
jgi:hypothetical protein